ncbi:hypothetical protein HYV12_00530 [Candidatus Dojkabacteria bacterium]|nr:hypothetical protein [Candidatus Dojkabacteria bacterium]
MGHINPNPTVFSVESLLSTDKLSLLNAYLFNGERDRFSHETMERVKEAINLVPYGMASVSSGRIFDVETLVESANDIGVPIHDVDYPWGVTVRDSAVKIGKTIEGKDIKTVIKTGMNIFGAYLLAVDPKDQNSRVQSGVETIQQTVSDQLRLRLDADQFSEALREKTLKNLADIGSSLGVSRNIQILVEPSILTFKEWDGFLRLMKDLRSRYDGTNIIPLISLDLANTQPYTQESVLEFIDKQLGVGSGSTIEVSQIGAFELSGFGEGRMKHDLPWKTPFPLKDFFMLVNKIENRRETVDRLGIVIESHPVLFDQLLAGLPDEYTKVLKEVSQ